jgi:hypothetical protein
MKKRSICALIFIGAAISACAGRDPEAIQIVQPYDQTASCTQIRAELDAISLKQKQLADEQGLKTAQNVAAGVGGFFTLGLAWFAMDAKGAASKDVTSLQARERYLTGLAAEKCAQPAQPPLAQAPGTRIR